MADEFLESLLSTIEKVGGGLSVTLNVNGALISGVLLTEEEYLAEMALSHFSDDDSGEGQTEPKEEDLELIRRLFNWQSRNEEEPPRYVHLSDMTVHFGPAGSRIGGGLWRGRAEAVEGFQLGRPESSVDDKDD